MGKIFCPEKKRVPEPYGGIQVNHCKNPLCVNFGVAVSQEKQSRGRHADQLRIDGYLAQIDSSIAKIDVIENLKTFVEEHGVDYKHFNPPTFNCKFCGETFPAKSNRGIYEEASRFHSYLKKDPAPSCPNERCENFGKSLPDHKILYKNKGFTTKAQSSR